MSDVSPSDVTGPPDITGPSDVTSPPDVTRERVLQALIKRTERLYNDFHDAPDEETAIELCYAHQRALHTSLRYLRCLRPDPKRWVREKGRFKDMHEHR